VRLRVTLAHRTRCGRDDGSRTDGVGDEIANRWLWIDSLIACVGNERMWTMMMGRHVAWSALPWTVSDGSNWSHRPSRNVNSLLLERVAMKLQS
jgi:hypothetical protein